MSTQQVLERVLAELAELAAAMERLTHAIALLDAPSRECQPLTSPSAPIAVALDALFGSAVDEPGPELVRKVRAAFVKGGTTLGQWCRENAIADQNARLALLGGWNGPKGQAMRARIIRASGLAGSGERAA